MEANADYYRLYRAHAKYGLSLEQAARLLDFQRRRCGICGKDISAFRGPGMSTDPLYFDHDRTCCNRSGSCGECVRGIVCHPCNITIASYQAGRIGKKTALLADAIRVYLADPPARRLKLQDEPRPGGSAESGPSLKDALEIVLKAVGTGELGRDDVARIMAAAMTSSLMAASATTRGSC